MSLSVCAIDRTLMTAKASLQLSFLALLRRVHARDTC